MDPVLIAGAGIGGLTLAAGLAGRGIPAVVLEQAEQLAPVGAGLTVQPNALLALRRLGLAEPFEAAGARLSTAAVYDTRGRVLLQPSRAQASALLADIGAPTLGLHRATIHQALVGQLGTSELRLASTVTAVDPDQATVTLANGQEVRGSVLVGADGLRSTVRTALLGAQAPSYSGYYCWRGVTDTNPLSSDWVGEMWGAGRRFGGCVIDGGRLYWFLCANGPAGGEDSDIRAALTRATAEFPDYVRQAVKDTPLSAIRRDDIRDRPPVTQWGRGRTTLLGDAAHPMTPNLGQGACQAIEDALALTDLITEHGPTPDALRRYERFRQPRANAVVKAAHRIGRIAHWSTPTRTRVRNTLVRLTPASVLVRQMRASWRLPETTS
ncbi:FAD-dependent monooxygenase [Streptomyces sp. NPDC058770]|uniref:FAD-dependent monooxygenase n=1 Tax=unclassified Streptomyces TaxID=2593676 RepID=UPI00367C8035